MADVIYDALRPHQYPTAPTPALIGCSGCAWTHPCARPDGPFTAHLAEVATAAVLEVTGRVLAEHYCMCGLVSECRCGWTSTTGTHEDHLAEVIAAALAGEG